MNKNDDGVVILQEDKTSDGKIIRLLQDDSREVLFSNGVRRLSSKNGYSIVYFKNKDIKECFPDGKIEYYFHSAKTKQITLPDGMNIYKFNNGQVEKH